jgi:hypothetical protein
MVARSSNLRTPLQRLANAGGFCGDLGRITPPRAGTLDAQIDAGYSPNRIDYVEHGKAMT